MTSATKNIQKIQKTVDLRKNIDEHELRFIINLSMHIIILREGAWLFYDKKHDRIWSM